MLNDKIFYADFSKSVKISFDSFLSDINSIGDCPRIIDSANPYECFVKIAASLAADEPIALADPNTPTDSLKDFFANLTQTFSVPKISAYESAAAAIAAPKNKWRACLFTSGTTGRPKTVSHSFESLARFAKIDANHANDVWGFAYSPTHIAGLQVFIQAILNSNTIVRLFGIDSQNVCRSLEAASVTHISATPTFYRLLATSKNIFPKVRRATAGGERFDPFAEKTAGKIFPNAKITNVYASTEAATLFSARADAFSPLPEIADSIKIENGELFVRKNLLGNFDGIEQASEWFATGDCVETLSQDPLRFKFCARKSDFINSGGFKINPLEVEDALRDIAGIADARVFAKKTPILGCLVCAEILPDENCPDEPRIRSILASKLQNFKLPRIISFKKSLPSTKNGKLSRNI